jgi:hypothetical protein
MKMFILSLDFFEDEVFDWYGKLGEGKISSLLDFFKIFLEVGLLFMKRLRGKWLS